MVDTQKMFQLLPEVAFAIKVNCPHDSFDDVAHDLEKYFTMFLIVHHNESFVSHVWHLERK